MGSADYFYKIDNAKTAVIIEAKQELDKIHIKKLLANTEEALFTKDELKINIAKTDSIKIHNKKIKKFLNKKIVDFDKYDGYTIKIIEILNIFINRLSKKEVNEKEENIKKFIIEPILELLDFKNASLEHGVENETYKTPQEQIKAYLQSDEFKTYKVYGILTNGVVWKLYYKDREEKISSEPIIEFNFSLLLNDNIARNEKNKLVSFFVETFKFTNLLANEKNFKCSLMDNLLEIDDCLYAENLNLSENLFKNIIDKGYIALAKGIANASKKHSVDLTPEQLEQYSMKILFRLIFVLYSEARGFLPLNQTTYYSRYSLEKIAIQLGQYKDKHTPIEDDLWARINDLFRAIDNGKMGGNIKIPIYNGGLFREFKDDLLNRIFIDNSYMIDVLFSLIYNEKKVTYDRIDYNLLDVKYIGTVYEKLLDYQIIKDGGNYRLKQKGDNNKRKDLGAYYTPDNVTKYIIKNAVDKKVQLFKQEFDKKYSSLSLNELYKLQDYCIYKRLFDLKIIDISCGSGHFLIDTIEHLANTCVELKDFYLSYKHFKSDKINEINEQQKIINSNDEFMNSSLQKATFRDVCKRFILKHCIYGMDVNPLATDITKFAIWLETFIVGIPLSFMDNHIRHGNSVLGFIDNIYNNIDINNLVVSKDNLFFNDMTQILSAKKNETLSLIDEVNVLIREINSNIDVSTKEIETNYASYAKIDARVQYLKFNLVPLSLLYYILQDEAILKTINIKANQQILDKLLSTLTMALNYTVWADYVETYFIYSKKPEELYKKIAKHRIKKDFFDEMIIFTKENREQIANKLSKIIDNIFEHDFTNWFLEFPDTKFDIVLGNPPYIKADSDGDFAKQRDIILNGFDYETLYEKWDLMMAFVERSYKLLKDNGIMSLIIKDDYLKAKYASKSREYFAKNAKINRIDFLSEIQIFSGIGVKNIILEYEKNDAEGNRPLKLKHNNQFEEIEILETEAQPSTEDIFNITPKKEYNLTNTIRLEEICYISVGMVANANEKIAKNAFKLKDILKNSPDAIYSKPFVEGKNLRRWQMKGKKYLEWNTSRVPSLLRRPTFPALYEQDEKIMLPMVGDIRAAYDDEKLYCNHGVFVGVKWIDLHTIHNNSIKKTARFNDETPIRIDLPSRELLENNSKNFSLKYLLAILNSSVAKDFLNQNRRNDIQLYPDDWKKMPIKTITLEEQQIFSDIVDEIIVNIQKLLPRDIALLESRLNKMVLKLYENPNPRI